MRVEEMKLLLPFVLILEVRGYFFTPPDVAEDLAALRAHNYTEYAALHGFELKTYEVVTPDGWILELWRVRSPNIFNAELSTPVVVAHGLSSSGSDYLSNIRNESTAFVLADNGYEVWLPNFRGTQYSNKKLTNGKRTSPNATDYYRACWQYMADIDFPCVLDRVLNETQQSKVYLVGHSMGATILFAFLSDNHSYDDKILHFAPVVPVLRIGYNSSFALGVLAPLLPPITRVLPTPIFEFLYGRQLLATMGNTVSTFNAYLVSQACKYVPRLCTVIKKIVFERDLTQVFVAHTHINTTRFPIITTAYPAGITVMGFYNYAMNWKKDTWAKIDFDELPQTGLTNMGEYNSTEPPEYNFASLAVPFSMFFVNNDIFFGHDVAVSLVNLLNATDVKYIDGNRLDHLDSVMAFDTRCYITNDIMQKFDALESKRDNAHKNYRSKAKAFVDDLGFEDGCTNKNS